MLIRRLQDRTDTDTRERRAIGGWAAHTVVRAGLTARGAIYLLVGAVALLVAFGQTSRQPDQAGALQLVASRSPGLVALWLLAIGLVAYALWRLTGAVLGSPGEGSGTGVRIRCLGEATGYGFLAYLTFTIVSGAHRNEARRQQDLTAQVLHHQGGQWLVAIAGLSIAAVGVALVVAGLLRLFTRRLLTDQMSPAALRAVTVTGVAGSVGRGCVIAVVGALVLDAAVTFDPAKSGGLDKALLTLREQAYGQVLLVLAALGLIAFGLYGLCEARWRAV